MRHLPAIRLLSRLFLAICIAIVAVPLCPAQDEPPAEAAAADPQLAELREQLASLRQELDDQKSRHGDRLDDADRSAEHIHGRQVIKLAVCLRTRKQAPLPD